MLVLLSQLNDLEIWGADVGNAYLELSLLFQHTSTIECIS